MDIFRNHTTDYFLAPNKKISDKNCVKCFNSTLEYKPNNTAKYHFPTF